MALKIPDPHLIKMLGVMEGNKIKTLLDKSVWFKNDKSYDEDNVQSNRC